MAHRAPACLSPVSVLSMFAAPQRQRSGPGYPEDRAPPTGCRCAPSMRCTPALFVHHGTWRRRHGYPKSEVRKSDVVIAPPGRNDLSSMPSRPSRHAVVDLPDWLSRPRASGVGMIHARGGVRWRRIERRFAARMESLASFTISTEPAPVQHRRTHDVLIGIAQKQRKR